MEGTSECKRSPFVLGLLELNLVVAIGMLVLLNSEIP